MIEDYLKSFDRELDFMCKYGLTIEESYLIQLILLAQRGYDEYLVKYMQNFNCPLIDLLQSLVNKKILDKSYIIPSKGDIFEPAEVRFSKKALEDMYPYKEIAERLNNLTDLSKIDRIVAEGEIETNSMVNIRKLYKLVTKDDVKDTMKKIYGKCLQ